MPRNPQKKRCRVEGCRAWAKRGQELCSAHWRASRPPRQQGAGIPGPAAKGTPLPEGAPPPEGGAGAPGATAWGSLQRLRTLIERLADAPLKDAEVIEQELRNLFAARALFLEWIEAADEREGADPARFLRAWNDSAGRVMQLLRTRQELAGEQEGAWGALLQAVYDQVEACVPVLQPKQGEAQGASAPPAKEER